MEVVFTETNSHHTVQIFKSFIFAICHETTITYFCFHATNLAQL